MLINLKCFHENQRTSKDVIVGEPSYEVTVASVKEADEEIKDWCVNLHESAGEYHSGEVGVVLYEMVVDEVTNTGKIYVMYPSMGDDFSDHLQDLE